MFMPNFYYFIVSIRPSVETVMYKLAEAKGSFQATANPATPQIGNLGDLLLLKMMADMMKTND